MGLFGVVWYPFLAVSEFLPYRNSEIDKSFTMFNFCPSGYAWRAAFFVKNPIGRIWMYIWCIDI